MIPPIGWITNPLLVSVLPVGHNAAKSIVFRLSSLLLQYTVFKILSYVACRLTAYTSFLMLMEDFIQQLYFISSRGVGGKSWIVVVFLILWSCAWLYDPFLWTLDAPGYIIKSTPANSQAFSQQIIPNPPYIISLQGGPNDIDIDDTLSANLYMQNITLIGTPLPLSQEVVTPLRVLSANDPPRIWLDEGGWSVGPDLGWPTLTNAPSCTPNSTDTQQNWSCHLNNTSSNDLFTQSVGQPRIWWDNTTSQPDILTPIPKENIWSSLGPNGSSAVMKQIFTLTKGQRRQTFLQTVWKSTMSNSPPSPFDTQEILDFVRRAWNTDPNQVVDPEIKGLADEAVLAQTRGDTLSMGLLVQESAALRASVLEYLTVLNPVNASDQQFNSLRIRTSIITLIRSETITPNPPIQPLAPCSVPFANLATAGRVRDTTCAQHTPTSGQPSTDNFRGQIDASTVVILPDILGKGDVNTSKGALDPQGESWFLTIQQQLEELMASRAFILGGSSGPTRVVWQDRVAAISYLQLILSLVPVVLAILGWLSMAGNPTSHYKHSFLAAVCATTHVSDNSCRRIGYLKNPPHLGLKEVRRHVIIGTSDGGTLVNVERDQVVANAMITEPLDLPNFGPANGDKQESQPMLVP